MQSTLNIAGAGQIQDLDVRNLDITHTFDGDLEITLIGPGGSPSATLVDNRGAAATTSSTPSSTTRRRRAIGGGAAPFTGSFRPETPLSVFDGVGQAGTWTLRIDDQVGGDSGTLTAWGMRKRTPGCS